MRRARRRIGISYASLALANPFPWAMRTKNSSSCAFIGFGKCIASRLQKSRSSSGFSQTTGKSGGAGIGPCCFMMVPPVYRTGLRVSLDGGAGIQARLVERGDRTTLEQVQEISGEGRLDVHRPAHLLFEFHPELRELRDLGPAQRRPLPQQARYGHLPRPPGNRYRHPLLRPCPFLYHSEVCLAHDPGVGRYHPRNYALPESPARRHDYLGSVPGYWVGAENHRRGVRRDKLLHQYREPYPFSVEPLLPAVGQHPLVAAGGPATGDGAQHGLGPDQVQLGFVLASKGGEIAIFVEGRGAHGNRDIRNTNATGQSLVGGSERRGEVRRQWSIGGLLRVESGGGETEARGNSVVGGKAAEVGSFAAYLSWVVACAIAEPKDVGYIRRGYHLAPCDAAYGTI